MVITVPGIVLSELCHYSAIVQCSGIIDYSASEMFDSLEKMGYPASTS